MKISNFVLAIVIFGGSAYLHAEEPPSLSCDKPEITDVREEGNATFTASGGSTDEPSDDQGCPPWTRTGNRQYTWYVNNVASGDEGDIVTSPGDGTTTTEDTLTFSLSTPGKIEVSVALQEEWQDSSNDPQKMFWPTDD